MKNTYLAIIAIVALATAAALTPLAVQQQVFAQEETMTDGLTSSTTTDNEVKQKCNLSGLGNDCHQAGKATLDVE
jgi:hypothetical protein